MRSRDVKIGHMYYGFYEDNSFAATFYVVSTGSAWFNCLMRYWPDSEWKTSYLNFRSFDWEEDFNEETDDVPDSDWLCDSRELIPGKVWTNTQIVEEYGLSFFKHIFIKGVKIV